MTRKDYRALAGALFWASQAVEYVDRNHGMRAEAEAAHRALADLRERLTELLAADNPRFDRERFLRYCETGR